METRHRWRETDLESGLQLSHCSVEIASGKGIETLQRRVSNYHISEATPTNRVCRTALWE